MFTEVYLNVDVSHVQDECKLLHLKLLRLHTVVEPVVATIHMEAGIYIEIRVVRYCS